MGPGVGRNVSCAVCDFVAFFLCYCYFFIYFYLREKCFFFVLLFFFVIFFRVKWFVDCLCMYIYIYIYNTISLASEQHFYDVVPFHWYVQSRELTRPNQEQVFSRN